MPQLTHSVCPLAQAAVLAREESASRAAAALAAAAHLDGVLRAARVASSVQAHTTGSPPQATLQALLTVCEEGQGREDFACGRRFPQCRSTGHA